MKDRVKFLDMPAQRFHLLGLPCWPLPLLARVRFTQENFLFLEFIDRRRRLIQSCDHIVKGTDLGTTGKFLQEFTAFRASRLFANNG